MRLYDRIKEMKIFFSFNKKSGFYSPNKSLLFFLLSIFCFMLLLGKSLDAFASKIKNPYILGIYKACVKPISDLSYKLQLDSLLPSARSTFLRVAKLEKISDWDSFYYLEANLKAEEDVKNQNEKNYDVDNTKISDLDLSPETLNIIDISNAIEEAKENLKYSGNENKETEILKEMLDSLGGKLENLNTLLDNINTLEQNRINELENFKLIQKSLILKDKKSVEQSNNKAMQSEEISDDTKSEFKKEYTYNSDKPLKILMVGDSQMHSIASGFLRLTGQKSSIQVKDISVHSSGFIRSDYYNWPKKLKTIFTESKNDPYDAVVIFLGMNDYQNFYGTDGKVLVKETENWEAAYRDKIKTHLDILLANTKKVYWLGMPAVRNKIYNAQLLYIENLHKKIAAEYSDTVLKKFSMSSVAPGEGVPYIDTLKTADGKKIKLMRDDGHHYTVSGGEFIMRSFLDLLYKEWDVEPCKP